MIAFFPEIYPDELLYSQLARYHSRSGYARYVFTVADIYKIGLWLAKVYKWSNE